MGIPSTANTFALLGGVVLTALLPACAKPTLSYQGEDRVLASYSGSTLKTELPPEVSVEAVQAAAESVLLARGYTITTTRHDAEKGRVVGRSPADDEWFGSDETVIRAYVTGAGTGITVNVEPWGDEMASRALLDALLARLGR